MAARQQGRGEMGKREDNGGDTDDYSEFKEDELLYSSVGEWMIVRELGRGTESIVFLAVHHRTGKKAAVKVVDITRLCRIEKMSRTQVRQRIEQQVTIIEELDHPCIVRVKETFWDKAKIFVLMDFVSGGELLNHIDPKGVHEDDVKWVFLQLLYAVQHCHIRGVVHRDLKLDNVLVEEKERTVKITDFGYANVFASEKDKFKTMCGTLLYMAPEVVLGGEYRGEPADIWSLGVILYCLLCGRFPFPDTPELGRDIVRGEFEIPDFLSREASSLLKKILRVNPKKRASFWDIIHSSFLCDEVEENSPLFPRHTDGKPIQPGDTKSTALTPRLRSVMKERNRSFMKVKRASSTSRVHEAKREPDSLKRDDDRKLEKKVSRTLSREKERGKLKKSTDSISRTQSADDKLKVVKQPEESKSKKHHSKKKKEKKAKKASLVLLKD